MAAEEFEGRTTELLQSMIRNACVNDGTPDSGNEVRNADLLADYFEGAGLGVERFESHPGRTSIVARIEGRDPTAPTLCLMGHTDVVPVNPDGWSRDPFGGEVVTGPDGVAEVWGRGAIDMLNTTSSMAVVFRQLAVEGFRPRGTLVYFGVADEEAGGGWGAEYILDKHWDAAGADYVLTELGGWSRTGADGTRRIVVNVAEKGLAWMRLRVSGTPGHGSMPYRTDNALVTAAEVVRRLVAYRPAPRLDDLWQAYVAGLDAPDDVRAMLNDPQRIDDAIATLDPAGRALRPRLLAHDHLAQRRPRRAEDEHDPRRRRARRRHPHRPRRLRRDGAPLRDRGPRRAGAQGRDQHAAARRVDTLGGGQRAVGHAGAPGATWSHPGVELVPGLIVGGTDARFYRRRGAIAYGAALFSPQVTFESFGQRFHGNDERIDVGSLGLSADFFYGVSKELVG